MFMYSIKNPDDQILERNLRFPEEETSFNDSEISGSYISLREIDARTELG